MTIRLLIIFLIFFIPVFAQKQGNIWYFGNHAGLDFSSGTPVAITNGQTHFFTTGYDHCEGTTAICDSSGTLLLYSDGASVWNRNHQIMPNGDSLMGHISSTQASLLVPKPESNNLFFLFTTDAFIYNDLKNGFRYSIIDMCLDNGLGDVSSNKKNILLLDSVAEKLTATKHANGNDYWILTHKYFSDAFYAYLLTANGISDTVVSHIGSVHQNAFFSGNTDAAIGQMKISPDGTKLALCFSNTNPAITELFSFNNTTGLVSNLISLPSDGNEYGLSFSGDNSKLYYSTGGNGTIYQYNLIEGNGNPDSIIASKQIIAQIGSGLNFIIDALELGPDGKIYVARENSNFLALINNPNVSGIGCNFQDNAVSLNGKTCSLGLPNFMAGYNYSNTSVDCGNIIEEFSQQLIKVFPNPSTSTFTIQLPTQQNFTLSVIDITGRRVYSTKNATGNIKVEASGFSSGVYFVKAVNERTVLTSKMVKE